MSKKRLVSEYKRLIKVEYDKETRTVRRNGELIRCVDYEKSEHCNRTDDMRGRRFGRLLIIEFLGSFRKQLCWLSICDCGEYKIINTAQIREGFDCCYKCSKARAGTKLTKYRKANHRGELTPLAMLYRKYKGFCRLQKDRV